MLSIWRSQVCRINNNYNFQSNLFLRILAIFHSDSPVCHTLPRLELAWIGNIAPIVDETVPIPWAREPCAIVPRHPKAEFAQLLILRASRDRNFRLDGLRDIPNSGKLSRNYPPHPLPRDRARHSVSCSVDSKEGLRPLCIKKLTKILRDFNFSNFFFCLTRSGHTGSKWPETVFESM